MLQNAYLLAKFRADTAENEQHFAEILPKIGNQVAGSREASGGPPRRPPDPHRRGPREGADPRGAAGPGNRAGWRASFGGAFMKGEN